VSDVTAEQLNTGFNVTPVATAVVGAAWRVISMRCGQQYRKNPKRNWKHEAFNL